MRSHLVAFVVLSICTFFGISFPSELSADTRQFGYSNVVPGLELFPLPTLPPTPSRPVGSLETFVVELDEAQQTVRFQVRVARHLTADLPNGFAVVMNGGGMPGVGTAPIVVFDGSTATPRITVARYMGSGNRLLYNLFHPNAEILFSGDSSSSQVLLATKEEDGDKVSFELQLAIADFNVSSASFPQWEGFTSDGDIGVWMDVYQNLSICYPFEPTGLTPTSGTISACQCTSDTENSTDETSESRDSSRDSEESSSSSQEASEADLYSSDYRVPGNEVIQMRPRLLEEEDKNYCYDYYGRLDVHLAPFSYKPDCLAVFLNGSGSTVGGLPVSSGLDQFAIGEEVEIQGACITPDNSSSILEYPSLPDGSIASVASGSIVPSGDEFFFGIPTDTAIPGDIFFIEFTCNGVNSYLNGINILPGNSCFLGFEVFDEASDEECELEDNTSILATLDGLSKDLDTLNRRIARKAKKRNPAKRQRVRTLKSQSADAAIDAWSIWIDLPTITYQCADPTISILDHSGARFDYLSDIDELELIGKRLARILRKGGAERRGKKFRRQVIELAELAREEAEKTPLQSSDVGL